MILDIIRAKQEGLLTRDEAQSYVQRTIESKIQEVEASAQEAAARAAQIIDSLEDHPECDCCDESYSLTATEAKELDEAVKLFVKLFEGKK